MRIGEALSLTRDDVDPANGVIKVINGKNSVSRYIPESDSLKHTLCNYAETIDMADDGKPFFCILLYRRSSHIRCHEVYVPKDVSDS